MTTINRRTLIGSGLALGLAGRARAQESGPIRLGFLTVKTGPLAAGGIQMEQGLQLWLKQNGNKMAGRPIELSTADTGGVPANTRTKTQELVERDNVSAIIGPLAAFEALAIDDYTKERGIPVFSVAAAEDITQRHPDPWFCRVTSSSAQCAQPLADYSRKELKYNRMITIGDDIAYGQEQNAGFQRVFEDEGGQIVQKLWPPLNAPDYGTFIAQLKNADGIFMSFAGSNGFRFFKQYKEYGGTMPIVGGMTAVDEAVLQQMGPDAIGMISTNWYSAQLDNPSNKVFVSGMLAEYKVEPGYYAAGTYVAAQVMNAALGMIGGKIEDKAAFIKAVREGDFPDTARGRVRFDKFGNVVGNVYIRKVEKKGNRLVNTVIKTYPDVSQFWTYDPAAFLKEPVYARDYPPARNLDK
ncbi:MAG: ABC transporter substrate-binding protein [Acetobacteraceae bacterium]|nr:ABC transporter substrate-binding protein [Acetobacteraceae bacterium]